jgi:hypothetical protein
MLIVQTKGVNMGPRSVLQLLFSEKIAKVVTTQKPLKLEKRLVQILESLEFLIFWPDLKQINNYWIKLISIF